MEYIAISSKGMISRISARNYEDACDQMDLIANDDIEGWILVTEKTAQKVAGNILEDQKEIQSGESERKYKSKL